MKSIFAQIPVNPHSMEQSLLSGKFKVTPEGGFSIELMKLKKGSPLPPYMAYPRFLIKLQKLPDTAKIVYMFLLDRARISMKNPSFTDDFGNVYLNYTIETLAKDLGKCGTTVKTSLRALEEEGLIRRIRQGTGKPNRIYVMVPRTENCPYERQNSVPQRGSIPSTSNNKQQYRIYKFKEGESL